MNEVGTVIAKKFVSFCKNMLEVVLTADRRPDTRRPRVELPTYNLGELSPVDVRAYVMSSWSSLVTIAHGLS